MIVHLRNRQCCVRVAREEERRFASTQIGTTVCFSKHRMRHSPLTLDLERGLSSRRDSDESNPNSSSAIVRMAAVIPCTLKKYQFDWQAVKERPRFKRKPRALHAARESAANFAGVATA